MIDRYKEYLKDKSVCLVGPAPTILEKEQREYIDNFDEVVRLNKALPLLEENKKYYGSKTTILYNCLNKDPESGSHLHIPYLEEEINWLVCPYPDKMPFSHDIKYFKSINKNRINFSYFNLEYYNELEKEMQTRPNTGVLAILDLLSSDIKQLYITGITFFKGGYIKEYRNYSEASVLKRMADHGNHHQEPQINFMKSVLLDDSRVVMGKSLEEIIKS